ncbi:hypothetical protein ACFLXG_04705 [Chloroflexota bacterium]
MTKIPSNELSNFLKEIEADKIGIARLEDWKDTPLYEKSKELLPEGKSIVVLAMEVFSELVKYLTSQAKVGEIQLRNLAKYNMELVNGKLNWEAYKIVKELHKHNFKGVLLPAGSDPFDGRFLGGVISYKHAGQAAGLGVLGWHSMLLTPEYGARVRLATIISNAPLKPTTILNVKDTPCSKCGGICIKICPVKAIKKPKGDETYNIDKYTCNAYCSASGGCAECLKVCPADNMTWKSAS